MSLSLSALTGYHGLKSKSTSTFFTTTINKAADDESALACRGGGRNQKGSKRMMMMISCCMQTWNPINNKKFETLSYLPPLSQESIAKEIDYMLSKGWIPCLEFDKPGYYDGRYWTLWKLPMFGCNDSSQVLNEIQLCKQAYPDAYIRCLAFDNKQQVQCMAFLIQTPSSSPASAATT
ncbi:Ribulose bisphosphate carboxylase small subunit, chloroplastic [Linum perenne]